MIAGDIMTYQPVTISADQSLAQALKIMQDIGCRHLPVISREGHVIGILSDRDCRSALNSAQIENDSWNNQELSNRLEVRRAMTPAPITTESDMPATEVARLMLKNRVGCLPVMRGETLVGIVTTSDILMAFINLQKQTESL
ncbi:MAG: CBS domain-containing protein [Anaerolineae bacterium]|nr:CBS domain-containing protein [Anaerolineae bacterium]